MSIAYEKLTIANSFIFGKITLDPNNCRIILESLMNETIDEISSPQREKHLNIRADGKFIKLDLYVQASRNRIFDAEMQNKSRNIEKQKELPKRSRYYQSIIDSDILDAGAKYLELQDTYIIFICTFDPFGKGAYKYEFVNRCTDYPDIDYSDGCHKIFFNTTGDVSNAPESTKAFYEYINTGKAISEDMLRLANAVDAARLNEEWRSEFMRKSLFETDAEEEGIFIGKEIGKDINLLEMIIKKLSKGKSLEQIADDLELSIDDATPLYNAALANLDKNATEIYYIMHPEHSKINRSSMPL